MQIVRTEWPRLMGLESPSFDTMTLESGATRT